MAQYNFEGDVENISDRQLEFINSVIQELGFADGKITFEQVGVAGDNYAANVKRIILEGENGNLSMIVKVAPIHEAVRIAMNSYLLFKNEHVMYTEVLPKLVQLQIDADVPEEEQLKYAKCYGSCYEQPNEVILLEDLKTYNYTMLDRFGSLSNECVKSVLKNFATLHSLSFVLKQKEPETFEHFRVNLIDMWGGIAGMDDTQIFFQGLEDDSMAVIDDPEYNNLLRHKVTESINIAAKFAKTDGDNKYSIIQQGDAWTNNIMFKFENDQLAGSIMIDYQLSKATSPVCDIMYMIFNCTDHETRVKNYHDWINYYHSELEKSLDNFSLKINFVYPRDKLDADLKRYGKLMFGLSIVLASMLIRKSEDAAKIKEAMESMDMSMTQQVKEFSVVNLDEETRTRFKNRVIGLIHSFTEFGLL